MTIASTARKAGPLLGNGSTTSFPFSFKVFATGDIKVAIANSAGVETALVEGVNYSVSLNANQETSPGGTVTYPISGSPLPSGSVLSIIGNLSYDQPLDLPSGGNFNPTALENQLDRATMQIQQLKEQVDRSAKLPQTSAADAESLVADIIRLADSADNLDTVAGSITGVNTTATNIADVNTVAGSIANVNATGGSIANVNTVAANLTGTNTIGTVAGSIANVNNTGNNIANVNTVAGISANVTTVAGNNTNVSTVAGISGNVTTVAGISGNVTTVAGISSSVTTVATNNANVSTVAGSIANVNTVAPSISSVNTVAPNISSVNTVSGSIANVNTVAGVAPDVTTVAGISANVNAVAGIAPKVSIVADNVADVSNFADVYYGPSATNPTLRKDGTALQGGDLYFNTGTRRLRVYDGTAWVDGPVNAGTITPYSFSGTGSQTTFTLPVDPVSENNTQVYISGVYQFKSEYSVSGTNLTFSSAPPAGTNNIEVVVITTMAIGNGADLVLRDDLASTAAGKGSSLVGFKQSGTGAVDRTAQDKLREVVSVKDFGASSSTPSFTSAISAANGRVVSVPEANNDTPLPADYSSSLIEYNGDRPIRTTHVSTIAGTAKKALKAQFKAGHADTLWSALHIEGQSQGSGKNGPSSADYGQTIAIHKSGYAGAIDPPAGEIDGLSIFVRQDGPKGQPSGGANSSDASGILVNIQNVEDVGFTSAWESSTSNYNRGTSAITRAIQTQIGAIDANQVGAPSYGYVAVATIGVNTSAFYAGSDSGAGASWTNILQVPGALNIDGSGNYRAPTTDWTGGAWSVVRSSGANGATQITHRGTGALFLYAQDAGAIQFGTNGAIRWQINSGGNLTPTTNLVGDIGGSTVRVSQVWLNQIDIGSTGSNGVKILSGSGSPEGVVAAAVGSLYLRRDGGAGTTLYVKQTGTGNTGWVAK